ncbi:MAG: M4 family metallopeptidase, partial [Bacteroidota bacterium]
LPPGLWFGLFFLCALPFPAMEKTPHHFYSTKKTTPFDGNVQPWVPVHTVRGQQAQQAPAALYLPIAFDAQATTNAEIIELKRSESNGLPIYIRSKGQSLASRGAYSASAIEAAAIDDLVSLKRDLQVNDPTQEFAMKHQEMDALGHTHVKFQQYYQGIPVYASEVIVHFPPTEEVRLTGRYHRTPNLDNLSPTLNQQQAKAMAIQEVQKHAEHVHLSPFWQEILDYTEPKVELVIYPADRTDGTDRLAWQVTIRPNVLHRWEYMFDAHTGEMLLEYDHTCSLVGPETGSGTDLNGQPRNLNIYNDNGTYLLLDATQNMYNDGNNNGAPDNGEGFVLTGDLNNTNLSNPSFNEVTSNNPNNWSPTAVSAHYNSDLSYTYFEDVHQRNSINGQGGDVYAFINVADENGGGLDNAFWNGSAMFYGNGNVAFAPLAGALDVGGHEMSHGVVQETANLEYQGQSGSLNESFADIFGVMIDRDDWLLGETVVNPQSFPSGALRSFSNPNQGGTSLSDPGYQPMHMNQLYTGEQNNGGVHINSGIPNHAFYLFVNDIGSKEKAEKIYYRALANYLTRSSQFIDCRIAVIQAAEDIHGANSAEVTAVQNAFAAVGIGSPGGGGGGGGGGGDYQQDLPVNPGQDYIVSYNLDFFNFRTLQRTNPDGSNPVELSQTEPRTKISITDNGQWGYFVGTDNHIYEINLNTGSENVVSNNPEWDNVAISKDGSLLAAITNQVDTSIYVFQTASGQGVRYILYNPTTSGGGENQGGVLYADAMDFDHSGQYIMYDAFNRIPNPGGTDLEYWDVGFLNVWDLATNNWGSGTIGKLFTNLPVGVSVGNAVFSKNSPYIIAYDELADNQVNVHAANIETGDIGDIWSQGLLGFPSFSKLDDKLIFSGEGGYSAEVVRFVDLQADKINADGGAFILIDEAKWGVWYATGERNLQLSAEEPILGHQLQVYPNPFRSSVNV